MPANVVTTCDESQKCDNNAPLYAEKEGFQTEEEHMSDSRSLWKRQFSDGSSRSDTLRLSILSLDSLKTSNSSGQFTNTTHIERSRPKINTTRYDSRYSRRSSMQSCCNLSPLLIAAKMGGVLKFNAIVVQKDTDILRRDPLHGQTVLHIGICEGNIDIVQVLLMPEFAGSLVNLPDKNRNTPLHLAVAKSRRLTKMLLDANADINFRNNRNQTPLGIHILTTPRDDPSITELFMKFGADPNAPVNKSTMLHVAIDRNLTQIALVLVRNGAQLNSLDQHEQTVFDKIPENVATIFLSQVSHFPFWVSDQYRKQCMSCSRNFSKYGSVRRHHCRFCGRLLCGACTKSQLSPSSFPFHKEDVPPDLTAPNLRILRTRKSSPSNWKGKQRVCSTCLSICEQENNKNATLS
uniref:Myosinlike protein putative n=1 Tax=Albugo laibachii Nc14 TaxID=890382 RepID=F0VYU5_9STRA|nr:myosinlike protein putative [Albugo laibachii Nc14]|eukprot:CCA13960.1 myosinlike protein putative [Albugo laibachii Nc14]